MTLKNKFRSLLIATFGCAFASAVAYHFLDRPNLPVELASYLHARSTRVIESNGIMFAIESGTYVVFCAISFFGLYFLWRPARVFYCVSVTVGILASMDPAFGPDIESGFSSVFDNCSTILEGVVLCLIFTSPVKELFLKKCGSSPL